MTNISRALTNISRALTSHGRAMASLGQTLASFSRALTSSIPFGCKVNEQSWRHGRRNMSSRLLYYKELCSVIKLIPYICC